MGLSAFDWQAYVVAPVGCDLFALPPRVFDNQSIRGLMAGSNRRLARQGPTSRQTQSGYTRACPCSGAGLQSACYHLTHSGRPEPCSGRANNMPESARRHHLSPRPMVTLAGTKPAPVACCSFVGGYPTLNTHTRPVLGLSRSCPLDTFAQAPPRATCYSPLIPRAGHHGISPRCRILGIARCSRTEN